MYVHMYSYELTKTYCIEWGGNGLFHSDFPLIRSMALSHALPWIIDCVDTAGRLPLEDISETTLVGLSLP